MKKRVIMILLGICVLCGGAGVGTILSSIYVMGIGNVVQEEGEIFATEEIYATNEESELYVELNNELVNAMNDFSAGKINEEEYLNICERINKRIDSQSEMNKLLSSEDAFREE